MGDYGQRMTKVSKIIGPSNWKFPITQTLGKLIHSGHMDMAIKSDGVTIAKKQIKKTNETN